MPHISIEPEGRQLKSHYARRVIPLTGVSLEAIKRYPEGFPRYRNRATLSAAVNKFLRANGLLETPRHSMYSLRHAFEDRMLAAGIDDRIRRDLFGHLLDRVRYGKGASLEHVAALVRGIAFCASSARVRLCASRRRVSSFAAMANSASSRSKIGAKAGSPATSAATFTNAASIRAVSTDLSRPKLGRPTCGAADMQVSMAPRPACAEHQPAARKPACHSAQIGQLDCRAHWV
ncbi:MAG: hypothetical protein RIC24_09085 [Hyphomicrobiales bacterium]